MKDIYDQLEDYLHALSSFELPSYKELPSVGLYMEQVLDYVNEALSPFSKDGSEALTSFMVNNYVKANVIAEPERKRYKKDQIGYLIAISLLKKSLSMGEISLLIDMDAQVSEDKSILYGFFKTMSTDIFSDASHRLESQAGAFKKTYEKEREDNPEKARKDLRDRLALLALRASVQAVANRLLASTLLSLVKEDMEKKPPSPKIERKISKSEGRKEKSEAKKLTSEKKRKEKIAKKKEEGK